MEKNNLPLECWFEQKRRCIPYTFQRENSGSDVFPGRVHKLIEVVKLFVGDNMLKRTLTQPLKVPKAWNCLSPWIYKCNIDFKKSASHAQSMQGLGK